MDYSWSNGNDKAISGEETSALLSTVKTSAMTIAPKPRCSYSFHEWLLENQKKFILFFFAKALTQITAIVQGQSKWKPLENIQSRKKQTRKIKLIVNQYSVKSGTTKI